MAPGCQGASPEPTPPPRLVIEVRDSADVVATVTAGHPCRATIDGVEMIVGGRPLLAHRGGSRWIGKDAENGTTLEHNDVTVARIHARQLFDGEGIPLLRVMDGGDVVDRTARIVRTIGPVPGPVPALRIAGGPRELIVTGLVPTPDHFALAAMLTAPDVGPELRALAACHYLLPESHER
jgi:hypothetical protein